MLFTNEEGKFCMLRHITMYRRCRFNSAFWWSLRGETLYRDVCWVLKLGKPVGIRICNTSCSTIFFIESQLPTKDNISPSTCWLGGFEPKAKQWRGVDASGCDGIGKFLKNSQNLTEFRCQRDDCWRLTPSAKLFLHLFFFYPLKTISLSRIFISHLSLRKPTLEEKPSFLLYIWGHNLS